MNTAFDFERSYVGVGIVIISAFVIFGGIRRLLALQKSLFSYGAGLLSYRYLRNANEH